MTTTMTNSTTMSTTQASPSYPTFLGTTLVLALPASIYISYFSQSQAHIIWALLGSKELWLGARELLYDKVWVLGSCYFNRVGYYRAVALFWLGFRELLYYRGWVSGSLVFLWIYRLVYYLVCNGLRHIWIVLGYSRIFWMGLFYVLH